MGNIVIMNFTDVYRDEDFYRHEKVNWIDCQDVEGTDCLCDSEASKEIVKRITTYPAEGVHFIDSGNYHYISKFWADKINAPFDLVLFDHHPDMKPTLFEGLLSCGSWVRAMLDGNRYLKKVILIGCDDALLGKLDAKYSDRIVAFTESQLHEPDAWQRFSSLHLSLPIYISVDKDVLSPSDDVTNWDQGSLTLKSLNRILSHLITANKVIGIDICGECQNTISNVVNGTISQDNSVNSDLLQLATEHRLQQ